MSSTNHHGVTTVPTLCVHHGISEQLLSVDVDRLLRDLLDHWTILAHPLLRETVLRQTWASKWGSGFISSWSRSHHYPRHDPHALHHHLESVERGRAGWVVWETWLWSEAPLLVNTHTPLGPHSVKQIRSDYSFQESLFFLSLSAPQVL